MSRRDRVLATLLALALSVALERIRGHSEWNPSEGVYALSSRMLLGGGDLYHGLVASQPPWLYLFGAIPLWIHDSLDTLRFACGLLTVGTGLMAAIAVMRLTGNRIAAIVTAPLVVVTPWATHQHGILVPEQLGVPLLMGAALLASRPGTARWGGIVAGLAVFAKLPFAVPAALAIAASPARGRAARWAAGAVAAQALLFTIIFGTSFWRQIVEAQIQGGHGFDHQIGPWVQAAWNLLPLVAFAGVAIALRAHAREPALLRTVGWAAAGALATTATIVKPGTGLNVLVPSEPLLTTLAVAGVVWALRTEWRVRAAVAASVLGVLMLAQSASLLIAPSNPQPFTRPGSALAGWKAVRTDGEIRRLVASARRCPAGTVYPGAALVAFIAHRRVPGDEPDVFIVNRAALHAAVRARVAADGPRCL